MSLHSSSSVNGKGSAPKDPLYRILDELRSITHLTNTERLDTEASKTHYICKKCKHQKESRKKYLKI